MERRKSSFGGTKRRGRSISVFIFVIIVSIIIISSTILNISNVREQQTILEESIEAQIMSVCISARDIVNEYPFADYNSQKDVDEDWEQYSELRSRLRLLAKETGVTFIYALKMLEGEPQFVIDSDEADEELFIPYELSQVHMDAFAGREGAGVMNVVDMYGTFNSGALPLFHEGKLIGIISVDIEDSYIQKSRSAGFRNEIISVMAMIVTLCALASFAYTFYRRTRDERKRLEGIALFDAVTGLPNRTNFGIYMEALREKRGALYPFLLCFIDLDNFKVINDVLGHDEGDVVLQRMGAFLEGHNKMAKKKWGDGHEIGICARIGGDEFLYVIGGITDKEVAKDIVASLYDEYDSSELKRYHEEYGLGFSVGVSHSPSDGTEVEMLINNADNAMYVAKKSGKNRFYVYNEKENEG